MGSVEPALGLNVPASHTTQAAMDFAPTSLLYFPDGQLAQDPEPASLNFPAMKGTHTAL